MEASCSNGAVPAYYKLAKGINPLETQNYQRQFYCLRLRRIIIKE